MTDNSKKLSELPQATTLASTDRVVILRDPSGSPSARTITAENLSNSLSTKLSINNAAVNTIEDAVYPNNYKTLATTLVLTKQVQALGTNDVEQDHHYYLPNGTEGQIMYFTAKTGLYIGRIYVWMEKLRNTTGNVTTDGYWIVFGGGWDRTATFAIFANGAWNIDGGGWGPQ
jgi:hypothetical protein